MSDLALARRLIAGDEAGFEVFFAIYFPRIYRFALSRLGNEDAAEEVGQAVLTAAVRTLHTYRGDPAMFAWLCVLCRREEFAWAERTGRAPDGARVDDQLLAVAVADDRTARVREVVLRAWQTDTRQRRARFRRNVKAAAALIAAAAAIVVAVRFTPRNAAVPAPPAPVAVVDRVDGRFRLEPGEGVPAGEWVQTQPGTHASLRLGDRTSIRLDSASRARLISATVVELSAGAVYVDTGRRSLTGVDTGRSPTGVDTGRRSLTDVDTGRSPTGVDTGRRSLTGVDTGRESSARLEVRTPLGIAHAAGTQFEVRLREGSLQVRVRSGTVELRRGAESISAPAGTQLTVSDGRTVSAAISPFGPEWEWASSVAPAFSDRRAAVGRLPRPSVARTWLDGALRRRGSGRTGVDGAASRLRGRIVAARRAQCRDCHRRTGPSPRKRTDSRGEEGAMTRCGAGEPIGSRVSP